MTEKIGKTQSDIDANLIFECRQIVRNIINFGVNDQQKIKIIELMSLELESRDSMNLLLETLKNIKKLDHSVKFSLNTDSDDYNSKKAKLLDL